MATGGFSVLPPWHGSCIGGFCVWGSFFSQPQLRSSALYNFRIFGRSLFSVSSLEADGFCLLSMQGTGWTCCWFLVAKLCLLLCDPMGAAREVSLSFTTFWSVLKLMCIELVMPSNHLILYCPLLLLPLAFLSIRVFSNVSALCIRWPKYWNFSFIISVSNEYSVLISYTIDWFDRLVVQGTLKSLLWHHNLKASILCPSALFVAQLSHPHMTTGKTIALTRWTFVGKVMPLLFNTLSRFVIALRVSQEFGKVICSSCLFKNFIHFVVIHTVKGFSVVSEAVDVFLEHLCFLYDTTDIGSSISDSSALKSAFSLEDLLKHFTLIFHFHQEAL